MELNKEEIIQSLTKELPKYLHHLRKKKISEKTIESYETNLKSFLKARHKHLPDLSHESFVIYFQKRLLTIKPNSANVEKSALSGFFDFGLTFGILNENPIHGIKNFSDLDIDKVFVTQKDLRLFEGAILRNYKSALLNNRRDLANTIRRDFLIYKLIRFHVLKSGEIPRIRISDIDLNHHLLKIKTRGKPDFNISSDLYRTITAYITIRNSMIGNKPNDILFCGKDGKPLSVRAIQFRFDEISRSCGVKIPITMSAIRSFRLQELHAEVGYSDDQVQYVSGYRSKANLKKQLSKTDITEKD